MEQTAPQGAITLFHNYFTEMRSLTIQSNFQLFNTEPWWPLHAISPYSILMPAIEYCASWTVNSYGTAGTP